MNQEQPSLYYLVQQLPEIYQPIFGHPELSGHVSRHCTDRCLLILPAYRALAALLGRPLRVLDLGCAQGYMSLKLAKEGAHVTGIDIVPANIRVCEALAHENPQLDFIPKLASIELTLKDLQPDSYDLVLGLSVFHHLIYVHGTECIMPYFKTLASCIPAALFELATHAESAIWSSSQPADERALLTDYPFVVELGRIDTHISNQQRPLLFTSSRYWYFHKSSAEVFDSWTTKSHPFAHGAVPDLSRRYFMNDRLVAKVFLLNKLTQQFNQYELNNEANFLMSCPDTLSYQPTCLCVNGNQREIWLVRERVKGVPLIDLMLQQATYDPVVIIRDVLLQLIALEARDLFHMDLRIWNILIQDDGHAVLIDYGSINPTAKDINYPDHLMFSFWIFVWMLTKKTISNKNVPIPPPMFSPMHLPTKYRLWAKIFWQSPPEIWSFGYLLETFDANIGQSDKDFPVSSTELWMYQIEKYLAIRHGY